MIFGKDEFQDAIDGSIERLRRLSVYCFHVVGPNDFASHHVPIERPHVSRFQVVLVLFQNLLVTCRGPFSVSFGRAQPIRKKSSSYPY